MSEIDLESKFPEMEPINKPPSLWTVNGFGLTVYGSRDFDEETGTYVKTQALVLLFIPIFNLRAYRVADTGNDGWYFIGREAISPPARAWNYALTCCLIAGISIGWWFSHVNSPEYIAAQNLKQAGALAESGDVVEAARLYREVARGETEHAATAQTAFVNLLSGPLQDAPAPDVLEVMQIGIEMTRMGTLSAAEDDLLQPALNAADSHSITDPKTAIRIVNAVLPVLSDPEKMDPLRRKLLEAIIKIDPTDPAPASELALLLEAEGDFAACEKLLFPHADRLGTTEGARILGQIYARNNELEKAHVLLLPYTEGRLKTLHEAEQAYERRIEIVQQQLLRQLNDGEGPAGFYQRYERAQSEEQQNQVVQAYFNEQLKEDRQLELAQERILAAAQVVPVALDLGIVLLQRATDLPDPEQRKAELEKAEKTFFAVRGFAGQQDEYRLFLGQVYYWLGKHDEGRALFDELLASQPGDIRIALSVANVLREVGARTECRDLMEKVYNQETDPAKKQVVANMRALTAIDQDDKILWLRRCDQSDRDVQANLNSTLGRKALQEGKTDEAITYLQKSIDIHDAQPETVTILNNSSLVYWSMFKATGRLEMFDNAIRRLDKAVALKPSDSILLSNAGSFALERAVWDIAGDDIDLAMLKEHVSFDLLGYLYENQRRKQVYLDRVRENPRVRKTLDYFDKVQLLAPKNPGSYSESARILNFLQDTDTLQRIDEKLESVELDLSPVMKQALDYYQGTTDKKLHTQAQNKLKQLEKIVAESAAAEDRTLAVASCLLAETMLQLAALDEPVDYDRIVHLADEAHRIAPSASTRSSLIAALCYRAGDTLARKNRQFAAFRTPLHRSLGGVHLIGAALSSDRPFRGDLLNNADVKRAVALIAETGDSFPDDRDPWEWAILRGANHEDADNVGAVIRRDEHARIARRLNLKLFPAGGTIALEACWDEQINGNQHEGRKIVQEFIDRGVPLEGVLQ